MTSILMRSPIIGRVMRTPLAWLGTMLLATATLAVPAGAVTQSWNGYKWARTGLLTIGVGNNLTGAWSPYLTSAATDWSADPLIDFKIIKGTSSASCNAVYGTVQVCNGNYGANGWLGYAYVWLSGGFIVQGTVRLNDYYFSMPRYNTAAWRSATVCQELGHTLGLAHIDVIRTNLNLGTCQDYTNDPSGTAGGVNGTKANTRPGASDFAALAGIYATPNSTQLAMTKPQYYIGAGFSIDDNEIETALTAVPEPSTWLMLLAGFGGVGITVRRRRRAEMRVATC